MAAPASAEQIRDVNTRYHDAAAGEYDSKWGIDFGPAGSDQVLGKLRKLLGRDLGPYGRSLEIGAGTGYFSLNLLRAGVVGAATCTDISPRMVERLAANARRLGVEVDARTADAEALPFADGSFDLVLGHAVLHHIPDLGKAFAEFHRVLTPGGTLIFAGEPSRHGDRIAGVPKRAARRAAPAWRALVRAAPAVTGGNGAHAADHALEHVVDVHAFDPAQLGAFASGAGFEQVQVRGEELLANWFGWISRTLEASAVPEEVPRGWQLFAYRSYLALQQVDRALLEPRLPPALFYNLMVAARRP